MAREVIWPSALRVSSANMELVGNAGESVSPLTGKTQTIDRSGDRWRMTLTVEDANNRASVAETAIAEAFIASIRNKNARVWVPVPGNTLRGSFPASEIFTNADFSNGTTGWTGGTSVLSVSDRVMKVTAGSSLQYAYLRQLNVPLTQYAPHVLRSLIRDGRASPSLSLGPTLVVKSAYSTDRGLITVAGVSTGTSETISAMLVAASSGYSAGDYWEIPFTSLSRCALVDNAPNLLTRSQELDHADWSKTRASVTANADTAPDGTSTAESIVEDSTASNNHFIRQQLTVPTAEADYTFSVSLKAVARSWAFLQLESTSGSCYAWVNLSTGALGFFGNGTNWTNTRAAVTPQGNGWHRLSITSTKASGVTTIYGRIALATGDQVQNYNGDGSSNILAWGASLAQSSVPVRYGVTTSAASSGVTQTGSGLNLKGLPVSTQNLAYAGDWCQIGNQLLKLTAPLHSDAAGLGYLAISPNIRTPFADNESVIFNQPMARMRLATEEMSWSRAPGGFGTYQLTFEEALDG